MQLAQQGSRTCVGCAAGAVDFYPKSMDKTGIPQHLALLLLNKDAEEVRGSHTLVRCSLRAVMTARGAIRRIVARAIENPDIDLIGFPDVDALEAQQRKYCPECFEQTP